MRLDETIALIKQRWPAVASSAEDEPVFILAAGWRCGSTLLQRMLLRQCLVWGEPYGSSGLIAYLTVPLGRFRSDWPEENAFIDMPRWQGPLDATWTANLYPPVQSLLDAHVAFLRTLFAEPSRARGYARWGLKEVRYGMEHAVYLHWVFPRAKFLFLVRNPYECWASYRRCQARWLRFYPEAVISTPEQFGSHWVSIVDSCNDRFATVEGFPVRYEQLIRRDYNLRPLASYLGFEPDPMAREKQIGVSPAGSIDVAELERLQHVVGPTADRLGYRNPFATTGETGLG